MEVLKLLIIFFFKSCLPLSSNVEVVYDLLALSVQDGDAAVSHCTCRQQRGAEVMRDTVQHGAGVWLIKHERLTGPVQEQPDPLGSLHNLQGNLLPCVAEGVVPVIVGQHPRLSVVAQPGLIPRAFALYRGIADPDLKGGTLAYVHHPAVGARGHGQRAQRVGPTVEPRRVVVQGLARSFVKEGQSAEVVGQGQERAHRALIKL